MKKRKTVVVMAIKPKYAEAIYSGKKRWEFRTQLPPVPGWVLIYESAPVSAVTGRVFLAAKIQGDPSFVWNVMKTQKVIGQLPGISQREFYAYCGKRSSVSACATFFAEPFDSPVPLPEGVRPPQNWRRYYTSDGSEEKKGGAK